MFHPPYSGNSAHPAVVWIVAALLSLLLADRIKMNNWKWIKHSILFFSDIIYTISKANETSTE